MDIENTPHMKMYITYDYIIIHRHQVSDVVPYVPWWFNNRLYELYFESFFDGDDEYYYNDGRYKLPPSDKTVYIFNFDNAPHKLQSLSEHGGDEDIIILVPEELSDYYLFREIDSCATNAYYGTYIFDKDSKFNQYLILIGAHA